jgi:hypothetical protein
MTNATNATNATTLHVKGSAMNARLRFVRERYGDVGLMSLLAEVSPATRAVLEGNVLPQAWVPFTAFVELGEVLDRLYGRGDLQLCVTLGRYAAEVNLPTLYKLFYRLGSPLYIFRRAAQLWSVHYDSGQLAAMELGDRAARLEIVGFASPHRVHCLSVLGWATRSIELSGGTVVSADEERCRARGDDTCEMAVRWR